MEEIKIGDIFKHTITLQSGDSVVVMAANWGKLRESYYKLADIAANHRRGQVVMLPLRLRLTPGADIYFISPDRLNYVRKKYKAYACYGNVPEVFIDDILSNNMEIPNE